MSRDLERERRQLDHLAARIENARERSRSTKPIPDHGSAPARTRTPLLSPAQRDLLEIIGVLGIAFAVLGLWLQYVALQEEREMRVADRQIARATLSSLHRTTIREAHDNKRASRVDVGQVDAVHGLVRLGYLLNEIDLSGLYLSGLRLPERTSLVGANLDNTTIHDATLPNVNMSSASLRGADLKSVDLTGALLNEVDATDARFVNIQLRNAQLQSADLTEAWLEHFRDRFTHIQRV